MRILHIKRKIYENFHKHADQYQKSYEISLYESPLNGSNQHQKTEDQIQEFNKHSLKNSTNIKHTQTCCRIQQSKTSILKLYKPTNSLTSQIQLHNKGTNSMQ